MADETKKYEFELRISSDYYQAFLTVHIFEEGEIKITPNEVLEFLKSKNVVFGIDLDAVDLICQNPKFAVDRLVAKGIPHVHGENGTVTFNIDKDSEKKPTMLANGKVDFKSLNILHISKKGDILAEKTDPTEGNPGTTVTGKMIKQKPGKAVNFKIGKNVSVSSDGLQMFSDVDGTIKLEDDKMSVIEVFEIRGDVGVKTGNIFFVGKVIVFGNVTTGYEIECEDLEVNGLIEAAKIKCSGDVTVSIGVQGNDAADIECGGNLKAQILNNCHLKVKGDINCDTIMHSIVVCDGEIRAAGRKGLIVGGDISARKSIRANVIGSEMGTTTSLKLGIDSNVLDEFKEINDQLKEAKDQGVKFEQLIRLLTRNVQNDPNNHDMRDNLAKLIPQKEQNNLLVNSLTERHMHLMELMNRLGDSFVVSNLFYPGVKVKIGNSYYNVKYPMKQAKLLRESGQIVAVPN